MDVRTVPANGISLAYETFGDPGDPAVVLIMGLGTQMIAWPDEMCQGLADHGYHVVRFDNRDVGLSTHLHDVRAPSFADVVVRRQPPPYTIDDMADDTIGLLDALALDRVHLVGASMGGFIAQSVALRAHHRLRSLTLMMTSTGSKRVGNPRPRLFTRLTARHAVRDRSGAQARTLETFRIIGSRGFAFDEEFLLDVAGRSYDRAHDPGGYLRQLAAIAAQPDRTRALRGVTVPSLVVHGLDDPLVAASGGLAAARALPGSTFIGFSGMGHDLPRALWPRFVDEIAGHASRADALRTGDEADALR